MRKWIGYQLLLIRLAKMEAKPFQKTLPQNYGEIIYSIFLFLLGMGLYFYYHIGSENPMDNLISSLPIALLAAIFGNVLLFIFYFVKSPKSLFGKIGVAHFRDLDIGEPEVELSSFSPDQQDRLIWNVRNKSSYPITSCEVKIRSLRDIENHDYFFPRESLRWLGGKDRVRIEPNNPYGNSVVSIMVAKDNNLKFITQPSNPHTLPFGKYLVELEIVMDYLWKKHKSLVKIEADFSSENKIVIYSF